MGLYPGRSPFQTAGLVWFGDGGMIKNIDTVTGIGDKPSLPFAFDALECDAGEAKKIVGAAETALTHAEVVAVVAYLAQATGRSFQVDGVAADGHYLTNVPPDQVVEIVDSGPNVEGNWRWDFTAKTWVLIHCVDAQGVYLGNVPDGQFAAIVPSAPPASANGETWRWDGSAWADVRSSQQVLADAIAGKLAALAARRYSVEIGGITLNGVAINTDRASQALIGSAKALSDIDTSVPIKFKGANGWFTIDAATVTAIALAVGRHVRGCFETESNHDAAIRLLDNRADVDAYDISTGWPANS